PVRSDELPWSLPILTEQAERVDAAPEPEKRWRSPSHRPPIGDHALLWKELHAEQEFSYRRLNPVVLMLAVFVAFCLGFILFAAVFASITRGKMFVETNQII